METEIKAIEKGSGESSIFFAIKSCHFNCHNDNRVDEIKEETKILGNGVHCDQTLKVYRGYKDKKLVFEIESNSSLTIYFK